MIKLFDKISSNFFNVLSSPNKEIYVDCLFIMYDMTDNIEESFQSEREIVVQKLMDYFDDREFNGDAELSNAQTSRQKAVGVINYLKECGWLGEEELGNYKTSLNFFDYSIKIIETLKTITKGETLEYTGDIFTIDSLLSDIEENEEEGVEIIEQAYQKTRDIIRKLQTIKANIYRHYHDIAREDTEDLQILLEKLLVDYKNNFFDHAYYNLKTKDSVPRYKRGILDKIFKLYNDEDKMDKLAVKVMETKNMEAYNEAFSYIENKLIRMQDSFNAIDDLVLAIDRKNEQYISAAVSKILFLKNHSDDIEGMFNRLFKIILRSDEHTFDYSKIFNFTNARNLDTKSLYTPRRYREDIDPEPLLVYDDLISDDVRREKINNLMKNNIFSKKEINKYVLELLNNRSQMYANEIPISTTEDYIKMILIFLYSRSIRVNYYCERQFDLVQSNFATFRNFKIINKKEVAYE